MINWPLWCFLQSPLKFSLTTHFPPSRHPLVHNDREWCSCYKNPPLHISTSSISASTHSSCSPLVPIWMPAYICCRLHLLPKPNPLDTCLTCWPALATHLIHWSLHPISDVIIRINSQIHAKLLWGSSWWWKDLQQFLFVVMVAACLLEKRQGFDYLASLGSFRLISIWRLGFQFAAAVVDGHCTDLGNDQLPLAFSPAHLSPPLTLVLHIRLDK